MNNALLYVVTVLIWGASWIGIDYQIAEVEPVHAVLYRYVLAGGLTVVGLTLLRRRAALTQRHHLLCAVMGLVMFAANYVLVYSAIRLGMPTGLAAVVYSLLIVMNAVNAAIFFRERPGRETAVAACLGIAGMALLFAEDVIAFLAGEGPATGALICVAAVYGASLGNMVARRLQVDRVDVMTANGWAMTYAAGALLLWSAAFERPFTFSTTPSFVVSLGLLTVFSTIVAFWCYLTLLGRIGAAKAAYAFIAFPPVALAISSVFEGYVWTPSHIAGVALILAGNLALLRGMRRPKAAGA